jgi:hypothetical protein
MVERWCDEKADTHQHECKSGTLQSLADRRHFAEQVLEDHLKRESEQNLRAKYQQARFVERRFEFLFQVHSSFPRMQ